MILLSNCCYTASAFAAFPSPGAAWPCATIGGSSRRHRSQASAGGALIVASKAARITTRVRKSWKTLSSSDRADNFQQDGYHANERRATLHKFVREVQPQIMEQFTQQAPPLVVNAMKQTITNMLGTLPPQFFGVTISTVGENLTQLMLSMMMTGYMFRNAQYRLEMCNTLSLLPSSTSAAVPPSTSTAIAPATPVLPGPSSPPTQASVPSTEPMYVPGLPIHSPGSNGLNRPSLPPVRGFLSDEDYAPGVQKTRVSGEVLRWHQSKGLESRSAVEYMEMLEAEVAMLRSQLARQSTVQEERNDLLEYMKTLEPVNLQELTATAEKDAVDAMHSFIQRLMGTADKEELRSTTSEITATELAKLLFWLMVVGYSLRATEVRLEMEKALDTGSGVNSRELPPGRL